ncbi:hypothetical protein SANT12839_097770 [Streptomyces antimycoticus]|uniref:Uncharacterized protein n=1 Tax=Streptomyces antimycoticus TaxID=68175 RepID=A0A4D4KIZ5_9ACTN|nr:hypothetical protein SANT12839_097770 [Streptomyces antimycoticus]
MSGTGGSAPTSEDGVDTYGGEAGGRGEATEGAIGGAESLEHAGAGHEAPIRAMPWPHANGTHYNAHHPHRTRNQLPPGSHQQPTPIHSPATHPAHPVLGGLINKYTPTA